MEEKKAMLAVLDSNWIGQGTKCVEFERDVAAYTGAREGVFVNSATAGLHLALMANGIGPGDEVITTAMTFVATVNVIEHCGATPILADIDPDTLNIAPADVARKCNSRTKAVIGVHFAGRPFDMQGVRNAVGSYIPIIEDAAHAIGGRHEDGSMVGSGEQLCVFSFYANKNMTTGEGGMVMTNDSDIAERIRIMRLHGLSTDAWKRFTSKELTRSLAILPGYKYNSTDMNAVLGIEQLKKLDGFLSRREEIARIYDRELRHVPYLEIVPRPLNNKERHALHLYIVKLNLERLTVDRNTFVAALREENIGAGIHYDAIHLHPFYRETYNWSEDDFPVATSLSHSVLTLPGQPSMTDDDVFSVIEGLNRVARHYQR